MSIDAGRRGLAELGALRAKFTSTGARVVAATRMLGFAAPSDLRDVCTVLRNIIAHEAREAEVATDAVRIATDAVRIATAALAELEAP